MAKSAAYSHTQFHRADDALAHHLQGKSFYVLECIWRNNTSAVRSRNTYPRDRQTSQRCVILSTSTAAAIVAAGVVNPSGSTRVLRATLITGVVKCEFSDGEDELVPDVLELPLPVRVGDAETYPFGLYVGSLILNTGCFYLVPIVALLGLRSFGDARKRWVITLQSAVVSTAAYLGFSYFGATSVKVLALVMFHPSTALEKALAVCCFLLFGLVSTALLREVVSSARRHDALDESSMDYATFSPLYDAARCPRLLRYRLYFFEELLVTTLFMFCDGIRPREGNCGYVALTIAAVTLLHFIFLIAMRPYESKLELASSLLSAVVLVGISVLATIATLGTATPAVMNTLGYLVLAESVVVFVQVGALALYAYVVGQKKKLREHQARVHNSSTAGRAAQNNDDDDPNAVALLAVPATTTVSSAAVSPSAASNPLLQY